MTTKTFFVRVLEADDLVRQKTRILTALAVFLIVATSLLILSRPIPPPAPPPQDAASGPYYVMPTTPIDRNQIGRAGWTLLHSISANFIEKADQGLQAEVRDFLRIWALLYPCRECSAHFAQMLREFPPVVDGKEGFSRWVFEAHNRVNERLNKPPFKWEDVNRRWGNPSLGLQANSS